ISQAALTQTNGPISVALRGSTTLSCTLQGVEFISIVHPSWYLQREGKAPQLLIYKSRERATGIPERFSGETYGNTAKLTVSSIEEGDEGDYYCADKGRNVLRGRHAWQTLTMINSRLCPHWWKDVWIQNWPPLLLMDSLLGPCSWKTILLATSDHQRRRK
uniref:Ig-like domain-containing protein n=1 Tax=Podarcis muralis TaxID=64176 RepID=A0A670K097_PODMU